MIPLVEEKREAIEALCRRFHVRKLQLFGLEDLFGRPVDLVMTSAVTNPYFLEVIADSPTVLYADSQAEQIHPDPSPPSGS